MARNQCVIIMTIPFRLKGWMQFEASRGCISDRRRKWLASHGHREIVDNAVDEALSGFGSESMSRLIKDGSLSVEDQGRGIPTGMHAME